MNFTKQTLSVFQNLLANTRVGVLDPNADVAFEQMKQARNELNRAIQESNSQPNA